MKTFKKNLKERAANLRNEITVIYYAYRNPGTGLLPKIIILFTLGYALSPIDLIPDFIPVLGYLDDLIIIPALITLSIKLIPKEVMAEARVRASNDPIKLKQNRIAASLIIVFWLVLLTAVVLKLF